MTLTLPNLRDDPVPTVQLRHTLPDGAAHIDWMIARDAAPGSALLTFRLPRGLHTLEPDATMTAEPIGDHRAAYLTYEGPISGNRGEVVRITRGRVTAARWIEPDCQAAVELEWLAPALPINRQRLELRRADSGNWSVILLA